MKKLRQLVCCILTLTLLLSLLSGLTLPSGAATGYDRGYEGAFAGDGKIYAHGLDVSSWQGAGLNFNMIKNAGYDYVILRVGTGKSGKDTCFETYYANAKAAGLDVGCYYYSYATTAAASKDNAASVLSWISGKVFEYPIYFDYEDSSQSGLGSAAAADICLSFMDTLRNAGYLTGLYSMASWLDDSWVTDSGIRGFYEGWIARYPNTTANSGINGTTYKTYNSLYCSSYGMYQYTSKAYIGNYGPYDANVCYKDYPTIVKTYGFNGYAQTDTGAVTGFGTKVSAKLKNWIFNADFYKTKYTDLAYMTDYQLYEHYLNYGITEGRQASALFNIKYYTNQNEELKKIYGSDYEGAFAHFVEYGQYEAARVYSKQLSEVRSVIFDPDFYCAMYPSVGEKFGNDVGRLFANFIKTGLAQGRVASAAFDVSCYINGNADLCETYNGDYYGAVHHFISTGQNEKRIVSPILDIAYYADHYADTEELSGLDAMKHFMHTGLKERRQGSANFQAEFYYFANEDVLTNYTADNCYLHYMSSGYSSGLLAVPYAQLPDDHVDLGQGFTAQLTNLKSGLNWSISGSHVIIYPASDSDAQKWKFVRQTDGSYKITNVKYGTVLTTSDNGSTDGVITIAEDVNGTNQKWYLYEVDGYYTLRTACNQWATIGLTSGSTNSGNTVEMAYYRTNKAQKNTITILSTETVECTQHHYLSSVTQVPACTSEGLTTYRCINCGDSYTETLAASGHSYENAVIIPGCTEGGYTTHTCVNCGDSYVSDYLDAAGHSYHSSVTAEPSCTLQGQVFYTCTECGDSYTEQLPAHGHSYHADTCTVCGYIRPIYYLVGEINGADYGCGSDVNNMGKYRFEDDKLVVTFTTDSHVFVKTEGNGAWYMSRSYCTDTAATLYHTTTGASEKLFVPGGVELTFTLQENPDGTLALSYVTASAEAPTLTLKYPTLTFEDVITMNVYFNATNLQDVVEMGLITYKQNVAEWNVDNAEAVVPGYAWSEADGLHYASTEGIAAKDLGDTIYFAVYAKLSDGSYTYTRLVSYSPKTYAYAQLSSGRADMRPLVVAMLNYGAAAQNYFNYHTEALVNGELTDEQKALVQSYRTDMMAPVVEADTGKAGSFTNTGGFSRKYPTVSFEGAFCINYYFTPSATPQGTVKLYYWTQSDYEAASVLTPINASGSVYMVDDGTGVYHAVVDRIAAKDLDKTVYVTAGYMSSGTSYCTGVLAYSIGAYCTAQAAAANPQQSLAQATAVYGYYARELFY